MQKLNTIQKRGKLNTVYVFDTPHPNNNGHHHYGIELGTGGKIIPIDFQNGARKEEGSISGILDTDLLEIVRHRLEAFQHGKYATRENAIALTHIEEALMWMNRRVEERIEREVLGTDKV